MTTEELTFCHLLIVNDICRPKKGKIKLFIPQPLHPMLCSCTLLPLKATCRKQQAPNKKPNFEWKEWGGVCIVLFSKVTPFEDNVYILSPIMGHNGIYWKECDDVPKNCQSTSRGGQGVRCALHRSKITTTTARNERKKTVVSTTQRN